MDCYMLLSQPIQWSQTCSQTSPFMKRGVFFVHKKYEKLLAKKCRSWWDGSSRAGSSGSTLFAKTTIEVCGVERVNYRIGINNNTFNCIQMGFDWKQAYIMCHCVCFIIKSFSPWKESWHKSFMIIKISHIYRYMQLSQSSS